MRSRSSSMTSARKTKNMQYPLDTKTETLGLLVSHREQEVSPEVEATNLRGGKEAYTRPSSRLTGREREACYSLCSIPEHYAVAAGFVVRGDSVVGET